MIRSFIYNPELGKFSQSNGIYVAQKSGDLWRWRVYDTLTKTYSFTSWTRAPYDQFIEPDKSGVKKWIETTI